MAVHGEDILEKDVDIDAPYAPAPAPAPEEIEQVQEGPVAEVAPPVAAPPAAAPPADVPDAVWDALFPRRSVYRDAIVKHALPRLLVILKIPANRLLPNRDLVGKALDQCKEDRVEFWGKFEVYTRRRSVCDAILLHYFDTLQDYAAGRRVV